MGDVDSANNAQLKRAGDGYGVGGETVPSKEADGAESGGDGGVVGVWQRGTAESPHSAIMYAAMMAAVAQLGQEGLPETPGGGLSPMELLGLTDLTQLAGLEPAP